MPCLDVGLQNSCEKLILRWIRVLLPFISKLTKNVNFHEYMVFSDINELLILEILMKTCGEVSILKRKLRCACKHCGRSEHVLQKQK